MELIMNYCALLVLVTLWTALLARVGSRDTFCYKKSKTAIRKDRDNLTRTERFLAKYDTAPTHAPFHTKLFWHFRIYNYSLCVVFIIVIQIVPRYAVALFFAKILIADIPLWIYTPFISSWRKKRFDYSKHPRP